MKKHMQEHGGNTGSLDAVANHIQSDLNPDPQVILRAINKHEASKFQEWLCPLGLLGGEQSSAENKMWDPGTVMRDITG